MLLFIYSPPTPIPDNGIENEGESKKKKKKENQRGISYTTLLLQ